jgi:hypothetical protein
LQDGSQFLHWQQVAAADVDSAEERDKGFHTREIVE